MCCMRILRATRGAGQGGVVVQSGMVVRGAGERHVRSSRLSPAQTLVRVGPIKRARHAAVASLWHLD